MYSKALYTPQLKQQQRSDLSFQNQNLQSSFYLPQSHLLHAQTTFVKKKDALRIIVKSLGHFLFQLSDSTDFGINSQSHLSKSRLVDCSIKLKHQFILHSFILNTYFLIIKNITSLPYPIQHYKIVYKFIIGSSSHIFITIIQVISQQMKGQSTDVEVDTNISYSLNKQSFNKHLRLTNKSDHTYIFKIKTNQKTVVSLQTTHDFILPHSIKQIAIKLADKPSETAQLKLEFNYVLAHQEDIDASDSRMASYPKDHIFRVVVPVHRMEIGEQTNLTEKIEIGSPRGDQNILTSSTPIKMQKKIEKVEFVEDLRMPEVKTESINIAEFVNMGKEETVEVKMQPQLVQQTPSEPPKSPVHFKTVESAEIKIQTPVKYPQLDGSVYHSAKGERSSLKADSKLNQMKQKSNQEALIEELQQKIVKQRSTIRTLEYTSSTNSVYPFPIIILLLIASFSLGSLLNYILI